MQNNIPDPNSQSPTKGSLETEMILEAVLSIFRLFYLVLLLCLYPALPSLQSMKADDIAKEIANATFNDALELHKFEADKNVGRPFLDIGNANSAYV